MPQQRIRLVPPMKGYSESASFAQTPESTTAAILNVVFLDPASQRFRIAQRAGSDLFDLFSFSAGTSITVPTIQIPAEGGDTTVQVNNNSCTPFTYSTLDPLLGLCGVIGGTFTVNTASGLITITPTADTNGQCQTVSLILCAQPNNATSGTATGSLSIGGPGGYGGGGGSAGTSQPACITCTASTNTTLPWLACYPCSEYNGTHSSVSFWVHQSIIGEAGNVLPIVKDNNSNSSTFAACLYVSGLRSSTPGGIRDTGTDSSLGGLVIVGGCDACNATFSNCISAACMDTQDHYKADVAHISVEGSGATECNPSVGTIELLGSPRGCFYASSNVGGFHACWPRVSGDGALFILNVGTPEVSCFKWVLYIAWYSEEFAGTQLGHSYWVGATTGGDATGIYTYNSELSDDGDIIGTKGTIAITPAP